MRTNTDNSAQNDEVNTSIRGSRDGRVGGQPDELERVTALNGMIRGVNEAQISATSREELASAVCERIADANLYRVVCMTDVPTLSGCADRWTMASTTDGRQTPPTLSGEDSTGKKRRLQSHPQRSRPLTAGRLSRSVTTARSTVHSESCLRNPLLAAENELSSPNSAK
jgi:hypothetical protein